MTVSSSVSWNQPPEEYPVAPGILTMSLPDLIEIVPIDFRVKAVVTVPGSKSITNRALILAALNDGETTLTGALWSEDTQVMVECLQELGFMVNVTPDPNEPCNRTITVYGKGGVVPAGGPDDQPMELFVGIAGTAARFLAAFLCLGQGTYRLHGVPRMLERPQAGVFAAVRSLGSRIDSTGHKLPAVIHGAGPRPGRCRVSIEESSQFASALLLSAKVGGWLVEISGEDTEEASYIAMTTKLIEAFPRNGGTFQIEPDASSGSYFWAADRLELPGLECMEYSAQFGIDVSTTYSTHISVANWPASEWQIDERFPKVMSVLGSDLDRISLVANDPGSSPGLRAHLLKLSTRGAISRSKNLGDSIMTAIAIAPLIERQHIGTPLRFVDLGRLRLQECERVTALRTELTKCRAKVVETGDTLEIFSSKLHGAEIETYNDHRMAMCFAILGLKVPGIKIKNPSCVKKTFPNFFQKLAAPPPEGLGAKVLDGHTGRLLNFDELFAD
jgi:3-phosphoshikimate 1-carboxyvinyltransferase